MIDANQERSFDSEQLTMRALRCWNLGLDVTDYFRR
jgi:hypothetical protein